MQSLEICMKIAARTVTRPDHVSYNFHLKSPEQAHPSETDPPCVSLIDMILMHAVLVLLV